MLQLKYLQTFCANSPDAENKTKLAILGRAATDMKHVADRAEACRGLHAMYMLTAGHTLFCYESVTVLLNKCFNMYSSCI